MAVATHAICCGNLDNARVPLVARMEQERTEAECTNATGGLNSPYGVA